MFEKVSQAAERAAVGVSRREWLGAIGRGALVVATSAGGLLATAGAAQAAVAWCGAYSNAACRGKVQGASCLAGRYPGVCRNAPRCACVPLTRPRG